MNNWIQATPERGRLRPLRARLPASSILLLLLLGGLLALVPTVRGATQLVFNPITPNPVSVGVGSTLTINVSVVNFDIVPPDQVFFEPFPLNGWPAGASILPLDGITNATFSWTPTAAQVGTTNLTVSAVESLNPANSNYTTFTVVVTNTIPAATPPSLTLPFTSTNISVETLLTFTATAALTDGTANPLAFSLDASALAAGASIDPTTGVFTWTPGAIAAGNSYDMTVIVTEANTSPLLTNSQLFTVNVAPLTNDCAQYARVQAIVATGGTLSLTDCTTLVLTSTLTVTAPNVTLDAGANAVTISGNNALRLFVVQPGASLTLNGLTLLSGKSDSGGAIYNNGGTVMLSNCVIAGNSAVGASGGNGADGNDDANYGKDATGASSGLAGIGGAIVNLGSLTAFNCQFTTNTATGGSGGNGGNGGNGSYRGGNGGHGGNGALAFGGAIYSTGGYLSLDTCTFSGNTAFGGTGGTGGTNGTGAFPGYMGTGGAGAEGSGGAVYCANGVNMVNCTFSSNTAQGGNSAASGQAGGGYGVKGAPGGSSFGGGVCLLGGGQLINCGFASDTVTGGNGGDGGAGNYIGGNGGNGGDGVGGCLYNYGGATVVNCTFSGCGAVGGVNGVAGSGPFSGRDGSPGSSATNAASTITATNVVFATGLPGGASPAVLGAANTLAAESGTAGVGGANDAQPETGPAFNTEGATEVAALPPGSPAGTSAAPNARPTLNLPGGPPGLPGTGLPALPRKPFAPVVVPPGAVTRGSPTNAAPPAAGAARSPLEEPLPQGMLDFRSADLSQVLDIYSIMVNRTILRPATLPAPTVTLTTRGQLTMGEGIQAVQAVLALNGIALIDMGDKFVKAVPEAQGGQVGGGFDTNNPANMPDMGQYVTHVVQLKYAKPSELLPILQPFGKVPGGMLAIDTSQILVLRDYTENVKRMLELVKEIDVAVPSEFVSEVIPIKYAQASDIASALNSLSSGGGGTTTGGTGTTGTRSRTSGTGLNRPGGMGGYPGQTTPGMQPNATGTTPTSTRGNSFSSRLQNIINRASGSTGEIQVLGQTKIIADERTNSLLIYAGKDDMKTIKEIVAKLDVVLAQVLIEAVVISVTLNDSHDLGFSYLLHPQNSGRLTGVGALNNNNMLQPSAFGSGTSNGIPQGFSYLMSWGQDLDVTVTAAESMSNAKILQTPFIQTSHNEPASLFVGESRPYPTSSYYGGGAYGGYSSIQQLQIGVTLEVTPLVNPDGLVVMDIHQKIDSFEGNVTIQNVGDVPVTSSKEASAKVSVRDHDTIILGGLMETDKNKSNSGVPLLSDIPVLGGLFRANHDDGKRTELLVLIRPTVLPTPEVAALTAAAQKNKMPGVRQTEKELRQDEKQRQKQADKADKVNSYPPPAQP